MEIFQELFGSSRWDIDILVASVDRPRYRTRKGDVATNILGVCDRNMEFIFVFPGWKGFASDSRVLIDGISRPNGLRVPTGNYFLADDGYTNDEGFLAPYWGKIYHLLAWENPPINVQEYFNMRHASARNVIEHCFWFLKMWWSILKSLCFYPIKT